MNCEPFWLKLCIAALWSNPYVAPILGFGRDLLLQPKYRSLLRSGVCISRFTWFASSPASNQTKISHVQRGSQSCPNLFRPQSSPNYSGAGGFTLSLVMFRGLCPGPLVDRLGFEDHTPHVPAWTDSTRLNTAGTDHAGLCS